MFPMLCKFKCSAHVNLLWKKHDSITDFLYCRHTVPLYIDAFVGSQKVEAVEDSVAGNLDIIHWKTRGKQKAVTF